MLLSCPQSHCHHCLDCCASDRHHRRRRLLNCPIWRSNRCKCSRNCSTHIVSIKCPICVFPTIRCTNSMANLYPTSFESVECSLDYLMSHDCIRFAPAMSLNLIRILHHFITRRVSHVRWAIGNLGNRFQLMARQLLNVYSTVSLLLFVRCVYVVIESPTSVGTRLKIKIEISLVVVLSKMVALSTPVNRQIKSFLFILFRHQSNCDSDLIISGGGGERASRTQTCIQLSSPTFGKHGYSILSVVWAEQWILGNGTIELIDNSA